MRILPAFLVACSGPSGPVAPRVPGKVVDHGTFVFSAPNQGEFGRESFTIVDRSDGGHTISAQTRYTKNGEKMQYDLIVETNATWQPQSGTFSTAGAKLSIEAGGDFYLNPSFGAPLTALCIKPVNGTLALNTAMGKGEIEVTSGPNPPYVSVSIHGPIRFELLCDGPKLIVIAGSGAIGVRPGHEKAAAAMISALGSIGN